MSRTAHNYLVKSIEKPALLLSILLLAGCQGGGGGEGPSIGSLLGTDQNPVSEELLVTNEGGNSEETLTQLAKVHNPEPATMVLMGSGMLAVGYLRRKQRKA